MGEKNQLRKQVRALKTQLETSQEHARYWAVRALRAEATAKELEAHAPVVAVRKDAPKPVTWEARKVNGKPVSVDGNGVITYSEVMHDGL